MAGPDFIKEISQNELDSKSIKVDSKQLDDLLEIKFKADFLEAKKTTDKYGVGKKVDLSDQKKREELQNDFNDYIDQLYNNAEKSEIDKAVQEFQFELNTLQTQVEIGALSKEVAEDDVDKSEKSDDDSDEDFKSKVIKNITVYNQDKIIEAVHGDSGGVHVYISGNVSSITSDNPTLGNELKTLLQKADQEYKANPGNHKSDSILAFQQKILSEAAQYKDDADYPLAAGDEKYLNDGKFGERTYLVLRFLAKKSVDSRDAKENKKKEKENKKKEKENKKENKQENLGDDVITGDDDKKEKKQENLGDDVIPGDDNKKEKKDDKKTEVIDKSKLTEVTDEKEKKKITDKKFDIAEYQRGKIQKDSDGNYYAEIAATIDGDQIDVTGKDLLKFDKDGNLYPDQTVKTPNNEREPVYFVDSRDDKPEHANTIRFLARYADGMYLQGDARVGVTYVPESEKIDYPYKTKVSEFNLMEGKKLDYQFEGNIGYEALKKHPKLKDIIDRMINEEDGKSEISSRKFKINLSPDNGLAKIIYDMYSPDSTNQKAKNLSKGTIGIKDIKTCFPYYKREGGADNERRRIAIILNQADEGDLQDFAADASDYGPDYEDEFEKAEKFSQVLGSLNEENVLRSLCDYNVDGQLSTAEGNTNLKAKFFTSINKPYPGSEYPGRRKDFRVFRETYKAKNKESKKTQEGMGDTGTIFGPQLYNEIKRAIAVMDVKLRYEPDAKSEYMKKYDLTPKDLEGDGNELTGEKIVITNIVKNISWISSNPTLEQAIKNIPANQRSKAKLVEMAKNYVTPGTDSLHNNGNFQPLFAKAIEEVNGSSSSISPDLFDNLVGVERISSDAKKYTMIDNVLQEHFKKHPDQEALFKSDGFTDTKHTFITGLMSALDNLQIGLTPTSISVSKSWDMEKYRHKIENEFTKKLIGGGLTAQKNGTIGLSLSTGKSGFSEDGNFQWERNTGLGVKYNETTATLSIGLNLGGESARQYNYDRVVTSRLDDVKSPKYVGMGGDIKAGVDVGAGGVNIGGGAGVELDWKQNPKQAIEQMNRQYRDVSSQIFHLQPANLKNLKNSTELKNALTANLNRLKSGTKQPMKEFIKNNLGFLEGNIKNVADYFDKKGIFTMFKNIPEEFEGNKKGNAINNLMQVLQTGIVGCRRDYMYDQLHGKVSITKIGVGVGIGLNVGTDGVSFRVPFPMLNFDISTWRKNYISSAAGKYMDQKIIRDGEIQGHGDEFKPEGKDLNVYAEYIKARYNIDDNNKGTLFDVVVTDDKLVFTSPTGNLSEVLGIRAKLDQNVLDNVSYDGTTLIIGDVKTLGMFSSADGQGVRNFLIIGQKGTVDKNDKPNTFILKPPHPPLGYQGEKKDIKPIKVEKVGYKDRTYEDVETLLATTFKAGGKNYKTKIEDVKNEILGDKGGNKTPIRVVEGKLFINGLDGKAGLSKFPTTGTLDFKKDSKGKITVSKSTDPTDKLEIRYIYNPNQIKETKKQSAIKTEAGDGTYFDFVNLFTYTKIDELFSDDSVLEKLSKLEDSKINILNDFLYNAGKDIDDDKDIDETEYGKASEILKKLLGKNYQDIVKILEGSDVAQKALVINRMKGIFATEKSVTSYSTLKALVANRDKSKKEAYKSLEGPSGKLPDFTSDYRQSILDKLADDTDISQDIDSGLVGYTAFYRKGTNTGKGFSITGLGSTKVLGGEMETLQGDDETNGRKWLLDNLDMDKVSLSTIKDNLNQSLTGESIKLKDGDITTLLSGESLDIGNKILTLKSECVFYLLGECANESLGIKFSGITITPKTPGDIPPGDTPRVLPPEIFSGGMAPADHYVGGINISSRNLSVPMIPGAYQHDVGINASGKDKKRKEIEGGDQGIEEEGGDQGTGKK